MTRRLSLLLVPAAVLGLLAAGCGGGKKSSTPTTSSSLGAGVVAVVGTAKISTAEFDGVVAQAKRSYALQKRAFPKMGSPDFQTLAGQIMSYLIQRSELAQKAASMAIKVTDKQITDRLKQIKKSYFGNSEKRYQAAIKQAGQTEADVRDGIEAQLISEQLYNKVTAKTTVPDSEVKAYYQQHLSDQYTTKESRDVRHVLVKTKALADKLYTQLKGGADFAAIVKKNTLDTSSKATGGKLTISRGQTVPEFDKVAFQLKKNEISKPVHTQFGWHVIQALSAVKPAKVTPLAKVKDQIRQQLLQTKKSTVMNDWITAMKKGFEKTIKYAPGYTPPTTATAPTSSASVPSPTISTG